MMLNAALVVGEMPHFTTHGQLQVAFKSMIAAGHSAAEIAAWLTNAGYRAWSADKLTALYAGAAIDDAKIMTVYDFQGNATTVRGADYQWVTDAGGKPWLIDIYGAMNESYPTKQIAAQNQATVNTAADAANAALAAQRAKLIAAVQSQRPDLSASEQSIFADQIIARAHSGTWDTARQIVWEMMVGQTPDYSISRSVRAAHPEIIVTSFPAIGYDGWAIDTLRLIDSGKAVNVGVREGRAQPKTGSPAVAPGYPGLSAAEYAAIIGPSNMQNLPAPKADWPTQAATFPKYVALSDVTGATTVHDLPPATPVTPAAQSTASSFATWLKVGMAFLLMR